MMTNTIEQNIFSFSFKTPFRVLSKSHLDSLLGFYSKGISHDTLLDVSFTVVPYEKVDIDIYFMQGLSSPLFSTSLSLLDAENMPILSSLGKCFDYTISDDLLKIAFELFEEQEELDDDFKEFVGQHVSESTCLAFLCYPNLFKTKFCFNFFDVITSNEHLKLLCSENPSPTKIMQIFFPMMKKKSLSSIKNIFSYVGDESDVYSFNSFSLNFPLIFKNEDKFSEFFNKVSSFYKKVFGDFSYVSQAGFVWYAYRDYDVFFDTISPFLGKNEHALENFFINSLEPILFEVENHYDSLDMGDDIHDGHLDVFQLIEYYIGDFERVLKSIDDFMWKLDFKHPRYKEICSFHDRFMEKYRAKNLLSLHDDFTFFLNDLFDKMNGEAHFGINDDVDADLLYNYDQKTLDFFNDSVNVFTFKLAESSKDLQFLGSRMQHCVGGYHNNLAENKNHLILGVFEDAKPVLCIEILNNEMIQAKKQHNRRLNRSLESDRKLIAALRMYILERGLEINTSDLVSVKI